MTELRVAERTLVARLHGQVDLATTESIEWAATVALASGRRRLVLDVSDVEFMDCSGLRALRSARRRMVAEGGALVLHRPSEAVRHLLRATRADFSTTDDGHPPVSRSPARLALAN